MEIAKYILEFMMPRKILASIFGTVALSLCAAPAWAFPTFENPVFSDGLTGWSYDGAVTLGQGNYAVVGNGVPGVSIAQAAADLNVSSQTLTTYLSGANDPNFNASTTTMSLLYQSVGGSYTATDTISFAFRFLYDQSVSQVGGIYLFGYVDDVTHAFIGVSPIGDFEFQVAGLQSSSGGPYSGTDGYTYSASQNFLPSFAYDIGTSDPVTFFIALTTNQGQTNPAAIAISFPAVSPAISSPEIDMHGSAVPVALTIGGLLLLGDRRRRLM